MIRTVHLSLFIRHSLIGLLAFLPCVAYADLLSLSNPAEMAGRSGFGVYAKANYLMATDFTSVKNFNGNWSGSYTPRGDMNLAMAMIKLESGVTYDSWRLSEIYRAEQLIEASRDAVDMIHFNKQHIPVPPGKILNINMQVGGFEAKGWRLDKGFKVAYSDEVDLSLGLGVSLLQGSRVRIAGLDGAATSTAAGYTYNLAMSDSNSRATYPFIRDGTPGGDGYSLDLGSKIAWARGGRLDIAVNDLFSQMTWRNMPNTTEVANSQTMARDAAGYIYYNPTLSGVNDIKRRTIVQKIPAKAHARFTYPVSGVEFFVGTDWMANYWFPDVGASYRVAGEWVSSIDYDVRFKAVGLGVAYKWINFNARSSSANLSNASAYGLSFELRVPL